MLIEIVGCLGRTVVHISAFIPLREDLKYLTLKCNIYSYFLLYFYILIIPVIFFIALSPQTMNNKELCLITSGL